MTSDDTRSGRSDSDFTISWLMRTLAVVAVSLVVFAGILLFLRPGSDDSEVIGAARVAWDPTRDDPLGEGKAASIEIIDDDGRFSAFVFDIEILRTPADFEFLEVWLTDGTGEDAERLSVGTFDEIRARVFSLPDEVDPLDFSRVEFSLESDDGDDSFSGRTLMSGGLVWLTPPPE